MKIQDPLTAYAERVKAAQFPREINAPVEHKTQRICPLLSIADNGFVKCQGVSCAGHNDIMQICALCEIAQNTRYR